MAEAAVLLKDESLQSNIDYVVLCTGYMYTASFIDEKSFVLFPNAYGDTPPNITTDGSQMHNLHLDIFYMADCALWRAWLPPSYSIRPPEVYDK